MLMSFDLDDYVYEVPRLGASGFMPKDAPADELIRAAREVATGDAPFSPRARGARADGRRPSNGEIAERLDLAEQTVKTHVGRVFAELQLRDRTQVVVFAYQSGLVGARFLITRFHGLLMAD